MAANESKGLTEGSASEFGLDRPTMPQLLGGWQKLLGADLATPAPPRRYRADPIAWLKKTLQAAISLEFATIPPYLCALWSIKDDRHEVARSIREVIQEEMLHMAMACNMLTSLGGTPKLCQPAKFVPQYPGPLPGKVHPKLIVYLTGLNRHSIQTFLTIERPAVFPEDVETEPNLPEPERTIGQVYDCIMRAFEEYDPNMTTDYQITGPLAWLTFGSYKDVHQGIRLIQLQGEGSTNPVRPGKKPPARPSAQWAKNNLAHYYRFNEIRHRKRLVRDPASGKYVYGGEYDYPDVWPMAKVPPGGYRQADVAPDVWHLVDAFDETYSKLLRLLQNAWNPGQLDRQIPSGQAAIIHAIDTMFELEHFAKPLMAIPIPGKRGTYGPCFRYKPGKQ
jgi:Ferritin-like